MASPTGDIALSFLDRFSFRPLETLRIAAPLGIRFWDPARGVPVTDGLTVRVRPEGSRRPGQIAARTLSGVYAVHHLPGLRAFEYPDDDTEQASPPLARNFVVEVVDTQQRFLPATLRLTAPWPGVYPVADVTVAPHGFHLFSAPTRPATSSLAAVRALLAERIDSSTTRPAPYAVLAVQVQGLPEVQPIWHGVADEQGSVAVFFPYPTFTGAAPAGSPLPAPLTDRRQRWPLSISVLSSSAPLPVLVGSWQPDLGAIFSQPPSVVWPSRTGNAPVVEYQAELVFGEELVLRTAGDSALVIGPGGSPP